MTKNRTDIYEEGRMDFAIGRKLCPYGAGRDDQRIVRWWNGWLDARTEVALRWRREDWGDRNELERAESCREI